MSEGVPIIGKLSEAQRVRAMQQYVSALEGMLELHKLAIREQEAKLDRTYAEAEKTKQINGVYVEVIQAGISTRCAAVSQLTGTLALLLCSGVADIPGPTNLNQSNEVTH